MWVSHGLTEVNEKQFLLDALASLDFKLSVGQLLTFFQIFSNSCNSSNSSKSSDSSVSSKSSDSSDSIKSSDSCDSSKSSDSCDSSKWSDSSESS